MYTCMYVCLGLKGLRNVIGLKCAFNLFLYFVIISIIERMYATPLQNGDHTVTRNGHVHCSQQDCILPVCINSKVSKIKKHIDASSAKRRARNRGQVRTVEGKVQGSTVTKEERTEQFWEDIESILKCNVSGDPEADSHYQHIVGNLDGVADPREQGSAEQSCFDQRGAQPVRSQPQPWIEGPNPHSLVGQNCNSPKTSRQILTPNQPMETEQIDLSHFLTALPQIYQVTNAVITPSNSIAPASDTPYDATLSDFGTGATSLEGFPINFIDSLTGKTQTGLNSREAWPTVGQTGSDRGVRTPRGRFQTMGKLFGILSQILQAFDGPYTAELEECYTSALQKALAEIQAVKGR